MLRSPRHPVFHAEAPSELLCLYSRGRGSGAPPAGLQVEGNRHESTPTPSCQAEMSWVASSGCQMIERNNKKTKGRAWCMIIYPLVSIKSQNHIISNPSFFKHGYTQSPLTSFSASPPVSLSELLAAGIEGNAAGGPSGSVTSPGTSCCC